MATPPAPVWCDKLLTGATVSVNGAMVEINLPYGWSGRLMPAEAVEFAAGLAAGVAEANAWAARWNPQTRSYDEVAA